MKHKIYSIVLLAALCGTALVGCKKDNPLEDASYNTIITVKNSDAKTQYDSGNVKWLEGDKISVIRGNSSSTNTFATFTIDWANSTQAKAKFTGTINNTFEGQSYYAIYPAQSNLTLSDGGLLNCVAIPTQQTLTTNTFGNGNNTAVGASPNTDMYFRNLGGLAKIAVRGDIAIKSIKITNNAATYNTLSGRGTIDLLTDNNLTIDWDDNNCADSVVATTANTTTGINVSGGTWFYLVLPPCTLSNYTVTITDVEGGKHVQNFAPTTPVTISRAKVTMLGGFEVNEPLPPAFTVNSSGLKVTFSPGNLRYDNGTWKWATPQYRYGGTDVADNIWEHFGWSGANTNHWGMSISEDDTDYSGETFKDWGQNSDLIDDLGTGWRTLSYDEWNFIFRGTNRNNSVIFSGNNTRQDVRYARGRVNGVNGMILFPDGENLTIDLSTVAVPYGINTGSDGSDGVDWSNVTYYTTKQWAIFENAGCVFLPAAGYRSGSSVNNVGTIGYYWSSTPSSDSPTLADYVGFNANVLSPVIVYYRHGGYSVRLVQEQH